MYGGWGGAAWLMPGLDKLLGKGYGKIFRCDSGRATQMATPWCIHTSRRNLFLPKKISKEGSTMFEGEILRALASAEIFKGLTHDEVKLF
jgi:hypothetical protein